LKKSN